MIDYRVLKEWPFGDIEHRYDERDTSLYALGLGIGTNPLDETELSFVYEQSLRALPTMAVVLGYPGFWMKHPRTGIDWIKVVHGEQSIRLHRSLPPAGTVIGRTRVKAIVDKGAAKGALVQIERSIRDQASGALLATVQQINFCRGDGGYSAGGQPSDPAPPAPPSMPQWPPHIVSDRRTRPETALIYRLSGDTNPLHADPRVARAAGFERPILHGLAAYGIAGYAILKTLCEGNPFRLQALSCRFTAPVFPGETIRTEIWRDGGDVLFRARVVERDVIALNHGKAQIA
jgi:acyl dehydratase